MLFKLTDGADQFVGILSDHLGDDGTVGGVFGDGPKDVGIEARVNVDAEVFGDVEIGPAMGGDGSQEGEVGDVLHGRQKKGGTVWRKHRLRSW